MTTATDSLGRNTGKRFNMAAIKRELAAKQEEIVRKGAARERKQARDRQYRLDNPVVLKIR